jgi:hypothetical protein
MSGCSSRYVVEEQANAQPGTNNNNNDTGDDTDMVSTILSASSDIATLSSCCNSNYHHLWMVLSHTLSQTCMEIQSPLSLCRRE